MCELEKVRLIKCDTWEGDASHVREMPHSTHHYSQDINSADKDYETRDSSPSTLRPALDNMN